MTFPVTSSEKALTSSQAVWNLNTQIQSAGDIYESDVSAKAFAIGPDSDVAQVKVSYFDPTEADKINEQIVSTDRPWVGRLDANLLERYSTTQIGRMFLSLVDIPPPSGFLPPSHSTERVLVVRPIVQVLQYLDTQPDYPPNRADKTYRFNSIGNGNLALGVWYIVPFYGRRFGQVTFKNLNVGGQPNVAVTTFGINFSITGSNDDNQEIQIDTDAAVIPGGSVVQSVTNQSYDALGIRLVPAAPFASAESVYTKITMSDKA